MPPFGTLPFDIGLDGTSGATAPLYLGAMEDALLEIVAAIKAHNQTIDAVWLDKLVRRHNRATHDAQRTVAKRRLLPFYLDVRQNDPDRWQSWDIDPDTEAQLLRLLKMKPRRTASGVATITVITKPWPCSSDCLYCPNDVRMPKSYLSSEPACQRAEHNFFDPYLQVKSRLRALQQMGHVTDKVELIVLGGTWSDYPEAYQRWFVRELFRAVSDDEPYDGGPERIDASGAIAPSPRQAASDGTARLQMGPRDTVAQRTACYDACGIPSSPEALAADAQQRQREVNAGTLSYNQATRQLMRTASWQQASEGQVATWDEVEAWHHANETSRRRVVGLVIETRPDLVTPDSARTMRRLGCTKVQMGIQSLDDAVLAANERLVSRQRIAQAFAVLRAFGFKVHVHFMVNLLGSTPEADKADYLQLVTNPHFCPDEVKLYPCVLVESSRLMRAYGQRLWRPYEEDELVDVLVCDTLATPAYTRISRMIRDISACDIVAGNKKTNLRQMVEARLAKRMGEVREIRLREIAGQDVRRDDLRLECVSYDTCGTREHFLQWVTDEGRIAGFCRLSLPDPDALQACVGQPCLPTAPHTAMIREVHVYGRVSGLGTNEQGAAQHAGLGRSLVEEACRLAREAGYGQMAVISSVGTRPYYRTLGFVDAGLYQLRNL